MGNRLAILRAQEAVRFKQEAETKAKFAGFCKGNWLPLNDHAFNASSVHKEVYHYICIKPVIYNIYKLGDIVKRNAPVDHSLKYWQLCDEDGWIEHVPTVDSVSPVPEGTPFLVKLRDGSILSSPHRRRWSAPQRGLEQYDIVAWKPVA